MEEEYDDINSIPEIIKCLEYGSNLQKSQIDVIKKAFELMDNSKK